MCADCLGFFRLFSGEVTRLVGMAGMVQLLFWLSFRSGGIVFTIDVLKFGSLVSNMDL